MLTVAEAGCLRPVFGLASLISIGVVGAAKTDSQI